MWLYINLVSVHAVCAPFPRQRLTFSELPSQAPFGMSCARRLGCHALLRWRQRMLRADNTSVIVIALPEPGKSQLPMHRDEVILNLAEGPQYDPPGDSRADTPLIKVRKLNRSALVSFTVAEIVH